MAWTKLDDSFWCHPKVMAAGNEVAGAYCRMLAYCGQHLTDGKVPEEVAKVIARPVVLEKLTLYSFVVQNGSGYLIPDYLEFNPSKGEILAKREARAEAGRLGGIASSKKRQANKEAKGEANA